LSASPDYIDPVIGWRSWSSVEIDNETCLSSLYFPTVWPVGRPLTAACLLTRRRTRRLVRLFDPRPHPAPSTACECGIYAVKPERFRVNLRGRDEGAGLPVFGRVSLWGLVHEHEYGWRASFAYPEQLYVPQLAGHMLDAEGIAERLALYDVPVEVVRPSALADELTHRPECG
jgi:hypothetical protein